MATTLSRRNLLTSGALAGGAIALPGMLSASLGVAPAEAANPVVTMLMTGDVNTLHGLQALMDQFHKRYPSIDVKPSVITYNDYDQRVDLLLAAGTPPTVWYPAENRGYRYYAARGYFPSIDAQIAQDHYDLTDFYKPLIDFCVWQGHHVGLPADWFGSCLIYNKTLFDKAKLPYPPTDWTDKSWDYDTFLAYARELTVVQGGKTVQWGTDAAETDDTFPFWIFGGEIFDRQGYVTGYPTRTILNTPEVADGFQFLRDLIVKYKVQPTPAQAQAAQAGAPSLFQTGKIGMEVTASWAFPGYAAIKSFEWGVAAVPWPPRRYGLPRHVPLYPDQWMVFKNQPSPAAAWALQSWLCGPEGMRLWVKTNGALPARKSLAPVFTTMLRAWNPRLSQAAMQSVVDAVQFGKVTPSHSVVNWSVIAEEAITPIFQKLQLGDLTGRQALQKMIPMVEQLLKENPAPR
jgi:multiple sugar transport system substrate-binding protein